MELVEQHIITQKHYSNILRKVAGNEFLSSRGFVVNPVKISYGFTKSLVEFL